MAEEGVYNQFPRGSTWHKWDLQVQTILDDGYISIDTYWDELKAKLPEKSNQLIAAIGSEDLIKKYDSRDYFYTDATDDPRTKSNNYAKLLVNFVDIFNENIGAICVTDHNYDDGYLIDALVRKSKNSQVKIVPGVEVNVQGVHMLVLFNEIPYENETYSGGIKNFLSKLDINNKKTNAVLTVSSKSYTDILKIVKELNALLIYPHCNSNNGLFQERGKTDRTHLADQFNRQSINVLQAKNISSANDTSSYIDTNTNLKSQHVFTLGSDARCLRHILTADDTGNYCWIKADPTFEGLKQIAYEPEDRVKIQELKPDEKEDYQIIDKIKFIDDDFLPEEILINQNLTTIIGGKSTGKSILLRNIARAIDADEVEKRLNEVKLEEYKEQVDDFRVFWRDKQENKRNEADGVNKKIIYIPQSYLNRLVDKQEDKTSIDEIVKNVLEQDEDVKKAFEDLGDFERQNEKNISKNIDDLFYTKNDIAVLTDGSKKIGDKKGITSEISKLKDEIIDLKKKTGMTEGEIKKYNELLEKIAELKQKQESVDINITLLEKLKTEGLFMGANLLGLSEHIYNTLYKDYEEIKMKSSKEWLSKIDIQEVALRKNKQENKGELDKLHTEFAPLLEKARKSKSLDDKIKKIVNEESKMKAILIEEAKIAELQRKYESLIREISDNQAKFYVEMFNAKITILKQAVIDGEITFDLSIIFRSSHFQGNFVNEICNLKNINQFQGGLLNEYRYTDSTKLNADVETIIRGVLNKNLVLKNSYSKKEAITKLARNWFIFDYKIKQNGDEISHMSPGKKSFVLLKLLIELDNSKCPILLDQPEDDLDNRSIYNDLVKFIKAKKKERQIIIATHNPNLVVGADAECVIVANQNGDRSNNKIYKFEYVEGALENTFRLEGEDKILYKQGIQEHVCDILEGGRVAFKQRKNKYNID